MKSLSFLFFLFFIQSTFFSQIRGIVVNSKEEVIFGASIFIKNRPNYKTISDLYGIFELKTQQTDDTILIRFLGYNNLLIPIDNINFNTINKFVLTEKFRQLKSVEIKWKDPISEKFAVETLKPLDIYLNPNSNADPLKAITILPFATTTDESANVSLRGGSFDRSRVFMNNIPVYNPVRNSQINGIGNFSLFNTELINKENVYASNPPLTFGNSSAGMIEINTVKKLKKNSLQVAISLANIGFFQAHQLDSLSFLQIYGNVQFSNLYIPVNKNSSEGLYNFRTYDFGLNYNKKINSLITFNSFNYFISESYKSNFFLNSFDSILYSSKNRVFSLNNFLLNFNKGQLSFNTGIDYSYRKFLFGLLNSVNEEQRIYNSINYKTNLLFNTTIQFGINHDYYRSQFFDTLPVYFYGLSKSNPKFYAYSDKLNTIAESYLYLNWDINKSVSFFSGFRSSIPTNNQKYYLSSQLGAKYNVNNKHNFLLSAGDYYSYSTPLQITNKINLLSSKQIAFDYTLSLKKTLIKSALYYKFDDIKDVDFFSHNFGMEFFIEQTISNSFNFSISNMYLNQKNTLNGYTYQGESSLNYFIKSTLNYNNPKVLNISLVFLANSGGRFTPVISSRFNSRINEYEPIFSSNINSDFLGQYERFDISINRILSIKKRSVILYLTLNNVFNAGNVSGVKYNKEFSSYSNTYFQLRSLYFGFVYNLK